MKERKEQEKKDEEKRKNREKCINNNIYQEKSDRRESYLKNMVPELFVSDDPHSDESEKEENLNSSKSSDNSSDITALNEKEQNELFKKLKTQSNILEENLNKDIINCHNRYHSYNGEILLLPFPKNLNNSKNQNQKYYNYNKNDFNKDYYKNISSINYSELINTKKNMIYKLKMLLQVNYIK